MIELVGALVAGVLTVLSPCVLPVLPVIVGGSISEVTAATRSRRADLRRALIITASLGTSVFAFTLLLKATTALIGIPPEVWQWISGVLLFALGGVLLFPEIWEWISMRLQLQGRTAAGLSAARTRSGWGGAVLTGAALGPVFASCSPLYAYVVVTVLPARLGYGLLLLSAYVVALTATLLLIAIAGQRVVSKLGWAVDTHSILRRSIGAILIVIGIVVIAGLDKDIQAWIIQNSPVTPWSLDKNFIQDR